MFWLVVMTSLSMTSYLLEPERQCSGMQSYNLLFEILFWLVVMTSLLTMLYPIELEIKDTTDTDRSASYLDLHIEIDSEGRLRTKLYDKRDNFNFPIVNFPLIIAHSSSTCIWSIYLSDDTIFQSLWFLSGFP